MKVKIGVSNHHVHLTRDAYNKLFNKEIEVRNYLNQIGEFAATDTVNLKVGNNLLENIRIVGPFRDKCQIELAQSDLDKLGIKAPIRRSGDLINTPGIIIYTEKGEIELEQGVIRAERHVHIPKSMENKLGIHERDKVIIKTKNGDFEANAKVSENGYFEVHIDKDDAKKFGVSSGEEVELYKCGKLET